MSLGTFWQELGETTDPFDAPDPTFKVERSDGSYEIVDAADEADAMRQTNNSYVGPAIIVAVAPYKLNTRRTNII